MGNCLCVLGDAMAMPVGSMIEKFRGEFEEHIERARMRATGGDVDDVIALGVQDAHAGPVPVH
jgi:NADH-quinone oxidoreductase subunit F